MRRTLILFAVGMLFCCLGFAGDEQKAASGEMSELKQFTGEIEKIDLVAKTITLEMKAPKAETTSQTQTSTTKQLQVFKFDDRTEIAKLEAEETPTTTKISDLESGDDISIYVDSQGLIQKIEILKE
jgi:Cu/Ag efflux protein CusF